MYQRLDSQNENPGLNGIVHETNRCAIEINRVRIYSISILISIYWQYDTGNKTGGDLSLTADVDCHRIAVVPFPLNL
jgi:hypothetical protein